MVARGSREESPEEDEDPLTDEDMEDGFDLDDFLRSEGRFSGPSGRRGKMTTIPSSTTLHVANASGKTETYSASEAT